MRYQGLKLSEQQIEIIKRDCCPFCGNLLNRNNSGSVKEGSKVIASFHDFDFFKTKISIIKIKPRYKMSILNFLSKNGDVEAGSIFSIQELSSQSGISVEQIRKEVSNPNQFLENVATQEGYHLVIENENGDVLKFD